MLQIAVSNMSTGVAYMVRRAAAHPHQHKLRFVLGLARSVNKCQLLCGFLVVIGSDTVILDGFEVLAGRFLERF